MKPQTRRSGLLTRELPDELLVYDRERHRAHCLNRTAALVFRHADGTRTPDELARLVDPAAGDAAVEATRLALQQLAEAGLLEGELVAIDPPVAVDAPLSRRDVAKRVGLAAAVLLPAVATVLAPTPAEAAATCREPPTPCAGQPNGTPCTCTLPPCIGTCTGGVCSEGC